MGGEEGSGLLKKQFLILKWACWLEEGVWGVERERERERERRGGGGGFTMGTIAAISDPWEVLMLASKGR